MSAPELDGYIEAEDARKALTKALRKLDEAKRSKAELIEAVYRAAAEAASGLSFKPVAAPRARATKAQARGAGNAAGHTARAETAISPLADWQLAKVTSDYSTDVCEERVEKLADKVCSLTETQRSDHPVNEVRVYLLGDLVEGELIFPGQAHLIDASLFHQVMLDGPRILGNYLRRLAATFAKVHVVGVIGNHGSLGGRARKDYHPESNADAMMYEATRLMLGGQPNVTWAPNFTERERLWYAIDTVGEHRFFLFHGDQIKGGALGFPWYGFGKKLLGWDRLYGFDYAMSGHFHTPVRGYYGGITHWGSGTTESSNTYAAENMAASGSPSQWVMFTHPKHGITAEYEVHL